MRTFVSSPAPCFSCSLSKSCRRFAALYDTLVAAQSASFATAHPRPVRSVKAAGCCLSSAARSCGQVVRAIECRSSRPIMSVTVCNQWLSTVGAMCTRKSRAANMSLASYTECLIESIANTLVHPDLPIHSESAASGMSPANVEQTANLDSTICSGTFGCTHHLQ